MSLPLEYVADGDWAALRRNFDLISRELGVYAELADFIGTGTPAGVIAASPGATYRDRAGGAGVTLYVKETGTGTAGWVAK